MERIQRALISVSDKTGLVEFARRLVELLPDLEILSTGGTARVLREASLPVREISEFTGFPEILDGRVKTLHPRVHGGLLHLRDRSDHRETVEKHDIPPIDLVVVNLYAFRETVEQSGVSRQEAIEQIDIGGPAMLRSAAKNHRFVTVVCRPDLYGDVLADLEANGGNTTLVLRETLATEVFHHTAVYDAAIATYLGSGGIASVQETDPLPDRLEISLPQTLKLRYGENPHQEAGFFGDLAQHFDRLHGKDLSFNNILDLTAAVELIEEFSPDASAAAAVIKHTNPCGVALGSTPREAWERALATDRDSASGGIAAFNQGVDSETAAAVHPFFTEIIAAPDFDSEAMKILRQKKNRILIRTRRPLRQGESLRVRSAASGLLVQRADWKDAAPANLQVVTRRPPTAEELEALHFAWKVVRHLKSNAIAFTAIDRSLGMGAGQMSRVDAARVAVAKAGRAGIDLAGSVVASDAFFPFSDGLLVCAEAGATAVIQPGGSKRDDEVIRAADERDLAMVFTGARHFRH